VHLTPGFTVTTKACGLTLCHIKSRITRCPRRAPGISWKPRRRPSKPMFEMPFKGSPKGLPSPMHNLVPHGTFPSVRESCCRPSSVLRRAAEILQALDSFTFVGSDRAYRTKFANAVAGALKGPGKRPGDYTPESIEEAYLKSPLFDATLPVKKPRRHKATQLLRAKRARRLPSLTQGSIQSPTPFR